MWLLKTTKIYSLTCSKDGTLTEVSSVFVNRLHFTEKKSRNLFKRHCLHI